MTFCTPLSSVLLAQGNLPAPLNDYKFIRAFTAYDECSSRNSRSETADLLYGRLTPARTAHETQPISLPTTDEEWHAGLASLAGRQYRVRFIMDLTSSEQTIEFLRAGNS